MLFAHWFFYFVIPVQSENELLSFWEWTYTCFQRSALSVQLNCYIEVKRERTPTFITYLDNWVFGIISIIMYLIIYAYEKVMWKTDFPYNDFVTITNWGRVHAAVKISTGSGFLKNSTCKNVHQRQITFSSPDRSARRRHTILPPRITCSSFMREVLLLLMTLW